MIRIRIRIIITTLLAFMLPAIAAEEKASTPPLPAPVVTQPPIAEKPPALELIGSFQLQMQKAFWDNNSKDNLDDFFGRINLGSSFKAGDFQTFINIRAFPVGFGYEALTGAAFDTSTDKLTVSKTKVANFQVEQGWFKYVWPLLEVRFGRFNTSTSKYLTLGNYLDKNPSSGFQSRLTYHNATEFVFKTGILTSNVILGAADVKLNTGYLRIYESIKPMKQMTVAAGYYGNVFDIAYNKNALITNRFDFLASYEIIKGLCPYFELGVIQKPNKRDYDVPLLIGCSIPTGKVLSSLAVEMEYLADRKISNEDKPVLVSIYADKKVGRTRFQAGLFSDPQGENTFDLRFGLRMTASLK
ncbi:MAG: hypothetical protein JW915_13725 [Chitinispirillaceae bacterium]|nr:hypothetical protein [Chitinispirillaceae bacterium]